MNTLMMLRERSQPRKSHCQRYKSRGLNRVSVTGLLTCITLLFSAGQALANQSVPNANQCITIGSKPLLGYPGSDHTIRNRCSHDLQVMWCADGYYQNASSSPGMDRSHNRNCNNGRVSSRNSAGYYYTTSRVRAGREIPTYSGTRGGQIIYAACPAEVNGQRVMPHAGPGGRFSCRMR